MTDQDAGIPAATIILLRERGAVEVLMVERHPDIAFAGGALVFPGGRIDPGDRDPAWRNHATGLELDPEWACGQIAAIREAFEETGVLLARRSGAVEIIGETVARDLCEWRIQIESDERQFLKMVKQHDLRLAADHVRCFAHWVAPPRLHKRFDTRFFVARAPVGQTPTPDGREAMQALWIRPGVAASDTREGRCKIIFPTLRNLERVAMHDRIDELLNDAVSRPISPICPTIETRADGSWLTIPEGLGYPVTAEKIETAMRG